MPTCKSCQKRFNFMTAQSWAGVCNTCLPAYRTEQRAKAAEKLKRATLRDHAWYFLRFAAISAAAGILLCGVAALAYRDQVIHSSDRTFFFSLFCFGMIGFYFTFISLKKAFSLFRIARNETKSNAKTKPQ